MNDEKLTSLVFDIFCARKYTYHEFEALANRAFSNRFCGKEDLSCLDIEKAFWREIIHGEKGTVEYGINVEESAFSSDPDDKLGTSNFNLKVSFQNLCLLNSLLVLS